MFRTVRLALGGLTLLVSAACVGAPARAPLPDNASPAEVGAFALEEQCGRARNQMDCYSEALLDVLERDGVAAAMGTLESLSERNERVRRDGHMYAHAIGLAASPSPEQVSETFRRCTPSFQSGCYHGVIQSYFAALVGSGGQVDAEAVNGLCAEYRESDADRWLLFQCVHGMGHGLTMLQGYHLPAALEGCDLLSDQWDREGCYGGVFMENIVNATTPHHTVGRPSVDGGHGGGHGGHGAHAAAPGGTGDAGGAHAGHAAAADEHAGHGAQADAHAGHGAAADPHAGHAAAGNAGAADHAGHHGPTVLAPAAGREPFPPLDRSDPLYPCSALDDRYLDACYMMQTSAILYHNGGDVAATARACDQAPEKYRGSCYVSLGRDISAITLQDHTRARTACGTGDPQYQVWCHIGYVKNLIDLTADPADALTYCRGVEGGELKQACYHAVGEQIWVLTSDRARGEEWCAAAEPGQQEHCRRGAGLASWRDAGAD